MQWFQDPSSYAGSSTSNDKKRKGVTFRQLLSVAFGLKSAPAFASMVSAEAARILRSFGVRVVGCYIDDFLLAAKTRELCQRSIDIAEVVFASLGIPLTCGKTVGPRSPEQGIDFLGVHVCTLDCSLSVTQEHRKYATERLQEVLAKKTVSLKELESLGGILTWISQVLKRGRPRRNQIYAAIKQLNARQGRHCAMRGELKRQLHWWVQMLCSAQGGASTFWAVQPHTPLVMSDASGEDGWGVCTMGFHIMGCWPPEWRASATDTDPHMLFKELLPPALTARLLAPFIGKSVLACALDNAGAAFSLNSLSCGCEMSLQILRWVADVLAKHSLGLLAGHAHREHNQHTDSLSHPLSPDVWARVMQQALIKKDKKLELHFVIVDRHSREAAFATIALRRYITAGAKGVRR